MRTHAGQVAFPGGRVDLGEDAIAAALREAARKSCSIRQRSTLLERSRRTGRSPAILVIPVVGVIPPELSLEPHEPEVADWFEAPLDFVLDPAKQERRNALFQGRERHYYEIRWNDRRIWGATAAMIVNLSRRLQWR